MGGIGCHKQQPANGKGVSMSMDLFHQTRLQEAIHALREDLIQEGGPQISTMRNYRFAIVQYDPKDEFKLRKEVS